VLLLKAEATRVCGCELNPLVAVAVPAATTYEVGDDTSFIQLFWVQMVTSHGGAGQTFISTGAGFSEFEIGPAYQLFTANLSLATMTIGASSNNAMYLYLWLAM